MAHFSLNFVYQNLAASDVPIVQLLHMIAMAHKPNLAEWNSPPSRNTLQTFKKLQSYFFVFGRLLDHQQCDQIGRFFEVLGNMFSYKSCINILWLFGLFWQTSFWSKNCCSHFWVNFWKIWATFCFNLWSLCCRIVVDKMSATPSHCETNCHQSSAVTNIINTLRS